MLLFALCAFPVYSWTILAYLEKLPSWLKALSLWDLVGTLSYTLAFALFESAFVLAILVGVIALLPRRLVKDRLVAVAGALVAVSVFWAVVFQQRLWAVSQRHPSTLLLWLSLYLLSIVILCVLIRRHDRLVPLARGLAERLTILLYVYVPLSVIGLAVLVLRRFLD